MTSTNSFEGMGGSTSLGYHAPGSIRFDSIDRAYFVDSESSRIMAVRIRNRGLRARPGRFGTKSDSRLKTGNSGFASPPEKRLFPCHGVSRAVGKGPLRMGAKLAFEPTTPARWATPPSERRGAWVGAAFSNSLGQKWHFAQEVGHEISCRPSQRGTISHAIQVDEARYLVP